MTAVFVVVGVAFVALVLVSQSVHILKQYERAVKFHLGRSGMARSGRG